MSKSITKYKVFGLDIPNIPWEENSDNNSNVLWRSKLNPIIPRDHIPTSNSIFNSAVTPFKGKFTGVFRCDDKRRNMRIHSGKSHDGINWQIEHEPINFSPVSSGIGEFKFEYGYDPRVGWIEDRYYITWCNGYYGNPTIGIAYTHDFKEFFQMENVFLPFNRNGVLFPRKINNKYAAGRKNQLPKQLFHAINGL